MDSTRYPRCILYTYRDVVLARLLSTARNDKQQAHCHQDTQGRIGVQKDATRRLHSGIYCRQGTCLKAVLLPFVHPSMCMHDLLTLSTTHADASTAEHKGLVRQIERLMNKKTTHPSTGPRIKTTRKNKPKEIIMLHRELHKHHFVPLIPSHRTKYGRLEFYFPFIIISKQSCNSKFIHPQVRSTKEITSRRSRAMVTRHFPCTLELEIRGGYAHAAESVDGKLLVDLGRLEGLGLHLEPFVG